MRDINRRSLMKASLAATLGASVAGATSAQDDDTASAPVVDGEIKRFATTPLGAEVTGPFVLGDGMPGHQQPGPGTLIFSVQHPAESEKNAEEFRRAGVGYVSGYQFDTRGVRDEFEELSIPTTQKEQGRVRVANGDFEFLAQQQQEIGGGDERFGVPKTPNGTNIDSLAGSTYAVFGSMTDMNQFVHTPDGEYDGYLYTNHETSPGNVSRMPLTVEDDGSLEPDLANTTNLSNYEACRTMGGTRINCYGDLTPWGTPVTSEEDYAHPRVSGPATVGDIVDADSGEGFRGAAAFYNRPNPLDIASSDWATEFNDGTTPQGAFALAGMELLAYYLGAEPVDQTDSENDLTPLASPFPNQYRHGRFVEFRNADAPDPADVEPVKHYVVGRAAWEAPDFQQDRRTVYGTSDGVNKGIYKFVADCPFPSYDDPLDVAGTLYAPQVTNKEDVTNSPPGEVSLELEWLELGHASNGEIESWVAEFDDVNQKDYLKSHTDWTEDDPVTETILAEADREVVENGNQDYIADQEILDWANQWENDGPDGVDENLRKIPFLETRAAAKEIGATIEFRKAEGIDTADPATPGDYIYIGLSEINNGLSDDAGDIQLDRVDGGTVYRAELESDYNISTLEPVIVGPDATDPASVADDALLNIDNLFVLNDGRVLCCEDADQLGRSYPNDGMYVYTPEEARGPGRGQGQGDDDGDDGDHEKGDC